MLFTKGHKINLKHGHCSDGKTTSTYNTWTNMLNRCSRPNDVSFKWYGARGITVCKRWRKFENFLADMGERPKGFTLDRLDSDKGYSPKNCRWATQEEQRANQRQPKGEANSHSKLTWKDVNAIRELVRRKCPVTQVRLAEWFGVTQTAISRIILHQTWLKV